MLQRKWIKNSNQQQTLRTCCWKITMFNDRNHDRNEK